MSLLHFLKGETARSQYQEKVSKAGLTSKIPFSSKNKFSLIVEGETKAVADFLDTHKSEDIVSFPNNDVAVRGVIKPHSHIKAVLDSKSPKANATGYNYDTNDIKKVYKFPTTLPSFPTSIGIISLNGYYQKPDLDTYWKTILGLNTTPTVTTVLVDGANPTFSGSGADFETTLDLEVTGGICPNANLILYCGLDTNTSFYNVCSTAIYDNVNKPTVISISWGAPETWFGSSVLQSFNQLFAYAAQQGINIQVATGDHGSGDGTSGQVLDFPSSSPYVTATGGTELYCSSPARDYGDSSTKEIAWSSGGGGISTFFPKPTWQSSIVPFGVTSNPSNRLSPDVSLNASGTTPWVIFFNNNITYGYGTSFVSPAISGLLGLIQPSHFVGPKWYKHYQNRPSSFHDITSGNNDTISTSNLYLAGSGYDCCTGLGSLVASEFLSFHAGRDD